MFNLIRVNFQYIISCASIARCFNVVLAAAVLLAFTQRDDTSYSILKGLFHRRGFDPRNRSTEFILRLRLENV